MAADLPLPKKVFDMVGGQMKVIKFQNLLET